MAVVIRQLPPAIFTLHSQIIFSQGGAFGKKQACVDYSSGFSLTLMV